MKILFVDENEDQRETYTLMLQDCFPKGEGVPTVFGVEPKPHVGDMSFLVENPSVVAIVLDEQLKESGVAQYYGIELASYLRTLNSKIPIYILTSFVDSEELLEGEMQVEDILNKQDLSAKKHVVGARILRRIDSYLEIMGNRNVRFELLLRKSVRGELAEEEKEELQELGYLRDSSFEVEEIISEEKLKKLEALEEKISQIENGLSKES
nr:response regulator [uncultured Pseudomonas sp.]